MDVKEVLCMTKGDGETSYAQNSSYTRRVAELSKPALERAVECLLGKAAGDGGGVVTYEVLNVADLGCSSNANTFPVMSSVIERVQKKCEELNCEAPEFQIYLNDLPENDFNTLFKALSGFVADKKNVPLFIMAAPGSFYGRLFPRNTLHLVHSSYAVHWLSKAPRLDDEAGLPLNKGKIYISKTSPAAVREAYLAQFEQDFGLFLKSRSQEMVPGGSLVLVLNGSPTAGFSRAYSHPWEHLAEAISALVSQGLIEEEKLDSFNIPMYTPTQEEVEDVVSKEGSFAIEHVDTFSIEVGDKSIWENAEKICRNVRCFTESVISHQFGEDILDQIYDKFNQITVEELATCEEPLKMFTLVVVATKN